MSAITKPWTHTTNVVGGGPSDPINVEHVAAVTKVDAPAASGANTTAIYHIVFKFRGENTTPQEITWKYEDETTRDADFDTLIANNSIAL